MVLLASAVPTIAGRSLVVSVPATGAVSAGADGGMVSIVKLWAALLALCSAWDSAAASIWCAPSARFATGANDQLPEPSDVVRANSTPSRKITTVVLGSAVPLIAGCGLLVNELL